MRKKMLLNFKQALEIRIHESYTEGTARPMTPVLLAKQRVERELAEIEAEEEFDAIPPGPDDGVALAMVEKILT